MSPNPFDLTGRSAIVTGASSGLGWHMCQVLARAGAKVALTARRTEPLEDLAHKIQEFDGRAIPIALDVTDRVSVKDCITAAETELGPISILVNNAGVAVTQPVFEQSEEDWDRVLDTNLKGTWLMSQEMAIHMDRLGHGGSIINMASILGMRGTGHVPSYCASKAGVINLTRALSVELARYNIRVNALAPGYIETDLNRKFLSSDAGQELKGRIPQKRFGQPDDLDGCLLLLASDASSFMTGSVLVLDGGHSAGV